MARVYNSDLAPMPAATIKGNDAVGAAVPRDLTFEELAELVAPYLIEMGGGQPPDDTLTALAALDSTAGLVEQTGADAFTKRAIGVAGSSSIPTRGDADARYQGLDATLTALAALDGTVGLVEVTALDTFTRRAIGVASSSDVLTRAHGDARYAPIADHWTLLTQSADLPNSTTTASASSDLKITPAAGGKYEIFGMLFLKSAAAATGARPGFQWPTGLSATASGGGGVIFSPGATPNSAFQVFSQPGATLASNANAHPSNTGYYPAFVVATLIAGGTPVGDFAITIESEVAASQVTLGAGSWIRYRPLP